MKTIPNFLIRVCYKPDEAYWDMPHHSVSTCKVRQRNLKIIYKKTRYSQVFACRPKRPPAPFLGFHSPYKTQPVRLKPCQELVYRFIQTTLFSVVLPQYILYIIYRDIISHKLGYKTAITMQG